MDFPVRLGCALEESMVSPCLSAGCAMALRPRMLTQPFRAKVESRLLPKEEAEFYHWYHAKQSRQMKSAANSRLQKSNGAVIRVTAVLD
jgi:hypothetical protein